MPINTPFPAVLIGTRSEESKRRRERIHVRRQSRAEARFALARYLGTGLAQTGLSLRKKAEIVEAAIDGGLLPRQTPTSHESIRQLHAQWVSGDRSVQDYDEEPRTGRRKTDYDPRLVALIDDAVLRSTYSSVRQLTTDLAEAAKTLPNRGPTPKYDAVASMIKAKGPVANMAARYGSRAAELRAQAHGTVPCLHTHDIWTVDEIAAPWHEQGWDPDTEEFVSVRPTIVLARDYKSGVPVGYHISDPLRRVDEATGRRMREGYDATDVFAALLAAACPEVSPGATRELAGHLPLAIRWDNHSTHKKLGPILNDLGRALHIDVSGLFLIPDPRLEADDKPPLAELGISTPKMRKRFPKSRGDVENLLAFVKRLCVGMEGHVDRVRCMDRLNEDPMDARTEAAAVGVVIPRREVLPPSALPSPEEQRLAFDAVVRRYIHTHRNRVHQRTAIGRYHQFASRSARKGRDILLALPVRSGYVQGNGIVVYEGTHEHRFTNRVVGEFVLDLGAPVTYRVDPLHRAIWAEIGGTTYCLPEKTVAAAEPGRAKLVAQHARAEARGHSDEAAAARAGAIDARHGAGAAAYFKHSGDAYLKLSQQVQVAVAAAKRAEERAAAAERALQAAAAHPGSATGVASSAVPRRSRKKAAISAASAANIAADAFGTAVEESPAVVRAEANDVDPTVDSAVRRGSYRRGAAT